MPKPCSNPRAVPGSQRGALRVAMSLSIVIQPIGAQPTTKEIPFPGGDVRVSAVVTANAPKVEGGYRVRRGRTYCAGSATLATVGVLAGDTLTLTQGASYNQKQARRSAVDSLPAAVHAIADEAEENTGVVLDAVHREGAATRAMLGQQELINCLLTGKVPPRPEGMTNKERQLQLRTAKQVMNNELSHVNEMEDARKHAQKVSRAQALTNQAIVTDGLVQMQTPGLETSEGCDEKTVQLKAQLANVAAKKRMLDKEFRAALAKPKGRPSGAKNKRARGSASATVPEAAPNAAAAAVAAPGADTAAPASSAASGTVAPPGVDEATCPADPGADALTVAVCLASPDAGAAADIRASTVALAGAAAPGATADDSEFAALFDAALFDTAPTGSAAVDSEEPKHKKQKKDRKEKKAKKDAQTFFAHSE